MHERCICLLACELVATWDMAAVEPTSKEAIALRLERARIALEFETQTSFARAIGREVITPQQLNNYVSGRDHVPGRVALALLKRFRISMDWLYAGEVGNMPTALMRKIEGVDLSSLRSAGTIGKRRRRRERASAS